VTGGGRIFPFFSREKKERGRDPSYSSAGNLGGLGGDPEFTALAEKEGGSWAGRWGGKTRKFPASGPATCLTCKEKRKKKGDKGASSAAEATRKIPDQRFLVKSKQGRGGGKKKKVLFPFPADRTTPQRKAAFEGKKGGQLPPM